MTTKTKSNSATIKTSDIGLAAALTSLDYELQNLDTTNIKKVVFLFSKETNIENDINFYWRGQLRIDARTLFENLKNLKNQIYSHAT